MFTLNSKPLTFVIFIWLIVKGADENNLTYLHCLFDRGHYFFSVYATRMMVAQGRGLIITISSMGGLRYLFNVPYGVGKAAVCLLLIILSSVLVFNHWQRVNPVLFFGFSIIAVWSAGSRYGVWTEKEWSNFCQPVARGCPDRAGESVCIG